MTTTFRQDCVSAIKTALDTYSSTNPTLLKVAYTAKPGSYSDLPCAYIGKRFEAIDQTISTRQRVLTVSVVLVDDVVSSKETMARLDVLVDGLLDALTAAMRTVPNHGPLNISGTEPAEEAPADGAGVYELEAIQLSIETMEGTD